MKNIELKVQYLKKKGILKNESFLNQEVFLEFKYFLNKMNIGELNSNGVIYSLKDLAIKKTTKALEKIEELERILSILTGKISQVSSSIPLFKALLNAIIFKLLIVINLSITAESKMQERKNAAFVYPQIISSLSIFQEEIKENKKNYMTLLNTRETIKIQHKITKEDVNSLLK
jgi:hypothetical protein